MNKKNKIIWINMLVLALFILVFGVSSLLSSINRVALQESEKQALIDEFENQIIAENNGEVDNEKPVETVDTSMITGDTIGIMRIPSIDLKAPIGYGATQAVIKKQVGMYRTTDKFITIGGNTGFAAHTSFKGGCSYCYFYHLREVKLGDLIYVDYKDGITYVFRVIDILNDQPIKADIPYKYKKPGSALITLYTCSDLARKRDFVVAEYIDPNSGIS